MGVSPSGLLRPLAVTILGNIEYCRPRALLGSIPWLFFLEVATTATEIKDVVLNHEVVHGLNEQVCNHYQEEVGGEEEEDDDNHDHDDIVLPHEVSSPRFENLVLPEARPETRQMLTIHNENPRCYCKSAAKERKHIENQKYVPRTL